MRVELEPRLGAQPPDDATILFDGGDLDHWESEGRDGSEQITWKKRANGGIIIEEYEFFEVQILDR
jgi:hypothetical protein